MRVWVRPLRRLLRHSCSAGVIYRSPRTPVQFLPEHVRMRTLTPSFFASIFLQVLLDSARAKRHVFWISWDFCLLSECQIILSALWVPRVLSCFKESIVHSICFANGYFWPSRRYPVLLQWRVLRHLQFSRGLFLTPCVCFIRKFTLNQQSYRVLSNLFGYSVFSEITQNNIKLFTQIFQFENSNDDLFGFRTICSATLY